jgi:hypothetical protein
MSTDRTHPEILFDSLVEEWNERGSVGVAIPRELEDLIKKYLKYSCAVGAESVLNKCIRVLQLVPHNTGNINYAKVIKTLRTSEPDFSEDYLSIQPFVSDEPLKHIL